MAKLELWYPLDTLYVAQRFGENLHPDKNFYPSLGLLAHNGWDMVDVEGAPVRATHDGLITFAGQDGAGGWLIVCRTHDEREYKDGTAYFKTIYAHLLPNIPVKAGQSVMVGDVIGYADTSGYATGCHLHFGLKPVKQGEEDWIWENIEQNNGYRGAINPEEYFNGQFAKTARSQLLLISLLQKLLSLLKLRG